MKNKLNGELSILFLTHLSLLNASAALLVYSHKMKKHLSIFLKFLSMLLNVENVRKPSNLKPSEFVSKP